MGMQKELTNGPEDRAWIEKSKKTGNYGSRSKRNDSCRRFCDPAVKRARKPKKLRMVVDKTPFNKGNQDNDKKIRGSHGGVNIQKKKMGGGDKEMVKEDPRKDYGRGGGRGRGRGGRGGPGGRGGDSGGRG